MSNIDVNSEISIDDVNPTNEETIVEDVDVDVDEDGDDHETEQEQDHETEQDQDHETDQEQDQEIVIKEMDTESNFLYDILHKLDNVLVGARVYIENNYFNFSDNDDIHMVFPGIYISGYSPTTNIELLKSLNIKKIITALPYSNPPFPELFNYIHIPLYDDKSENIQKYFSKVNEVLESSVLAGENVIVHCMAGRSRSVTLVMAFLIWIIKGNCNINLHSNVLLHTKLLNNSISNINDSGKCDSSNYNDQDSVKYIIDLIMTEATILNLSKRRIIDKVSNANSRIRDIVIIPDGKNDYDYSTQNYIEKIDSEKMHEKMHTNIAETPKPTQLMRTANFVIYKKTCMINDLIQIQDNYWHQLNKEDNANKVLIVGNLVSLIGQYLRKYRPIACPNDNFIDQL